MIFVAIMGVIFLADYLIKGQVEKDFNKQDKRLVAKDKIVLRKLYNKGIAFGWFKGKESITIVGTAMVMGAAISTFVALLFKSGKGLTKLGYAMIIGGGFNNLYERCMKGYVTDYFSFNVKCDKIKRIVFNISDMFIIIGSLIVLLGKIFGNKNK